MSAASRVRRMLLGLSPAEASFARRGFHPGDAPTRAHLERVGRAFVHGYNAAVEQARADGLGTRLRGVPAELRGFAFEGAAMGLALLDRLTPWRRDRFARFVAGDGAPHVYMAHVGAGWALARLRRPVGPMLARCDPLLGWLVLDGYGFHEGYFSSRRYVARQAPPSVPAGYARRVFDQGLGRSLWFLACADPERLGELVARFAPRRRADLWSGIGLACAYAGGGSRATAAAVTAAAGPYRPHLAQGAAFAATARQRAGNPAPHTARACEIICGLTVDDAAAVTDEALIDLPGDGAVPAYELWRRRIAERLAPAAARATARASG